ncbi:MAG: Gfo/Idh/MocA family oxidoreductase [Lentisphaerae bacterium]|nr:Gfo/Idh/MocA family oxidoreductase [Lentisphaerota bacterium]
MNPLDVTIIGGGMITNDVLLPSIYHLQRTGAAGQIRICALNTPPLKALRDNPDFKQAFPNQSFTAHPDLSGPEDRNHPDLYKKVLAEMPPRQVAVVAMPVQMHHEVVMEALRRDQHVLCVKPLVQKFEHAEEIREEAFARGLFVGVEYHKRFDRRSLIAKRHYELGHFGEFAIGEARLFEPYYYRNSNFQNWFEAGKTDPFVYIGCHYVDLVYFITGLKPVEVSVSGVRKRFPNGKEAYMWANGRVRFENGALLSVTNGLGYPDEGAGSNDQGMQLFFEGEGRTGMLLHDDQYRGVAHGYIAGVGSSGSFYNYINPDFFRMAPWEGAGFKPSGYGYDSVAAILGSANRIERETAGMSAGAALARRREMLLEIDRKGLLATPANSHINELVVEAARLSILSDGEAVRIEYGAKPRICKRNA